MKWCGKVIAHPLHDNIVVGSTQRDIVFLDITTLVAVMTHTVLVEDELGKINDVTSYDPLFSLHICCRHLVMEASCVMRMGGNISVHACTPLITLESRFV